MRVLYIILALVATAFVAGCNTTGSAATAAATQAEPGPDRHQREALSIVLKARTAYLLPAVAQKQKAAEAFKAKNVDAGINYLLAASDLEAKATEAWVKAVDLLQRSSKPLPADYKEVFDHYSTMLEKMLASTGEASALLVTKLLAI